MATFNDGDPIDASSLQKLQDAIINLELKMPEIGKTTGTTTYVNADINQPQIIGNKSKKFELVVGKNDLLVEFVSPLKSTPKSVVVSSFKTDFNDNKWHPEIIVTKMSQNGFQAYVYLPATKDCVPNTIQLNYIAICY